MTQREIYQCPICPESFTYNSEKQLAWNIRTHEMGDRHNLHLKIKKKKD